MWLDKRRLYEKRKLSIIPLSAVMPWTSLIRRRLETGGSSRNFFFNIIGNYERTKPCHEVHVGLYFFKFFIFIACFKKLTNFFLYMIIIYMLIPFCLSFQGLQEYIYIYICQKMHPISHEFMEVPLESLLLNSTFTVR